MVDAVGQTNGVQLVRDVNNNGLYDLGTDNLLATTNYSGSTATFTLTSVTIAADNTENWLVVYDYVSSLIQGETYRARVTNLTDLNLTGVTSGSPITASGSVPIAGGTMTASTDFPLPVELVSFAASGEHGFISLKWVTESEINNLGFSIERKKEKEENFELIASYKKYNNLYGAGTTSSQTEYIFNDSTAIPGVRYVYRLLQHDYSGKLTIEKLMPSAVASEPLPTEFELAQNYPNPFNPETTIKIALPEFSEVKITIFNTLGQKILILVDEEIDAGTFKFKWNGANETGVQTSSGIYFYILQIKTLKGNEITKSRKMLKLK